MNVLLICTQTCCAARRGKGLREVAGVDDAVGGNGRRRGKARGRGDDRSADMIFVMENHYQRKLAERFGALLEGKPPIILRIRDDFKYMEPKLIEILKVKAPRHLLPHEAERNPRPVDTIDESHLPLLDAMHAVGGL
jgi:predicted protein tyrosine phosphatase